MALAASAALLLPAACHGLHEVAWGLEIGLHDHGPHHDHHHVHHHHVHHHHGDHHHGHRPRHWRR